MPLKAKKPMTTEPRKAKIVIFGKAGIGKTWLSLDFPKCYYIDPEGGASLAHYQQKLLDSGGAYLSVEDGANDPLTVIGQLKALATEKHDFQTVAIGSITKLYQTIIAQETERLGVKDVFGASKKPAIAFMRQLVQWIQKIDMNVVLEAHEIAEWAVVGKERQEIGQVPDCWDKLLYELDLSLQIKKAPHRLCVIKKSRLVGFPENETFPCNYHNFAERYGKDFLEKEKIPIELISAEQLAELQHLLGVIVLSEKEIDRIKTRASVSDWSELNTQQASQTINWLKGKI